MSRPDPYPLLPLLGAPSMGLVLAEWLRTALWRPGTSARARWQLGRIALTCAVVASIAASAWWAFAAAVLPVMDSSREQAASADVAPVLTSGVAKGARQRTMQSTLFVPHELPRARPVAPPQPLAPQLAQQYQLQGVMGTDPPRALVLDTKTQQTHTLVAGQFLGQLEVVDVQPTRVLLRFQGETFELGL